MNFCSEEQDKSKIIKKINVTNGVNFEIEYLDDSISRYVNYNPEQLNKIKDIMIEQAKERDKQINYNQLVINKYLSLATALLSSYCLSASIGKNISLLAIICLIIDLISIKNHRNIKKQLKELKKYKFYFEMIKDGETEFEDISEPDKYYREVININTLNNKSLSDLKFIKKYRHKLN